MNRETPEGDIWVDALRNAKSQISINMLDLYKQPNPSYAKILGLLLKIMHSPQIRQEPYKTMFVSSRSISTASLGDQPVARIKSQSSPI